jgi:hypothetical protein
MGGHIWPCGKWRISTETPSKESLQAVSHTLAGWIVEFFNSCEEKKNFADGSHPKPTILTPHFVVGCGLEF